ncbi:Hsp70 family protein [Actinomycetospora termitidis]|uniref:Hsp70 family protein n=1 Tax=Actinomycetospora termitidis TaxID=3053470 RepID=A0ABT7M2W7_9PSEU|nr:hsp70 family protein [Actinomycetospora sp. Odt1-22]MDL5154377.1 Hsp70 family protein [Actinomycetospora sp. Odt1-22]
MSTYRLGIDLGTTYTAAAVCRRSGDGWSEPEIVALGSRSASVSSVLYLGAAGEVLVGEAAERRAHTEPERVVRQFKRRVGDDVPLVVGDAVHTAHALAARLARWVVDKVAEREGGPADTVAVTHPASWGDHKRELLAGALREVGLTGTTFLPEPQAAAVAYAAKERVETGSAVAVYDLGGGTFDAAVVRKSAGGFELPGRAEGIEQLGGVDFDDRVLDHARAGIGAAFDELDPEDPDVQSAVRRLRQECVEAKEALSADTEVTIPVMLPSVRTNVRLTRHEFESMIRSSLDHTVDALTRTVSSAGLSADDLQAVLLVGGSSRIPLVAQMVSEALGRPVAVDADPKTSIAVGAVLTVAPRAAAPARSAARAASTDVPNAAAAAAATSTMPQGAAPARSTGPSSGLLDLRSAASTPTPSRPTRTGPPSTPVPATGPGSSRFPAVGEGRTTRITTGPGSGRMPAAPIAPAGSRSGPGSGYFAAPQGPAPASTPFRSPAADDRTTVTPGGRTPPRPPVAAPAALREEPAAEQPETVPRSRTRLLVTVAAAVVVVAAATTGGVVYARNASVSATVVPPAPTTSEVVPAVVAPPAAVVEDPSTGGTGSSGGTGGSAGSRGGSSSGGSGSSSGGSSGGGHHGSTTTTTKPTWKPEGTPEPSNVPTPDNDAGSGSGS